MLNTINGTFLMQIMAQIQCIKWIYKIQIYHPLEIILKKNPLLHIIEVSYAFM